MSNLILTRIDSPEGNIVNLSKGEVSIGRGSILGCDDKRISRQHAILRVFDDPGVGVVLIANHSNSCFYKEQNMDSYAILTYGSKKHLHPGDEFSLLPSSFRYRIGLTVTDVENTVPGPEPTSPPSKRRRVLPGWLTDLPGNEPTAASSSTDAASRKRKASVTKVDTVIKEEPPDRAGPCDVGPINQAGLGSTGPIDQAGTGDQAGLINQAGPIDQAGPGSTGPTNQAGTDDQTGPTDQAGPASAGQTKDGYEAKYGGPPFRQTCVYGATCFRKNPQHRQDFSHPGDGDFKVDLDLPECLYGTSCYRKNLQHRRDYRHTQPPAPAQAPAPGASPTATRTRRGPRAETGEDSEDDYDLDDPFLNDASSDDYQPTSSEDSAEDEEEDEDEESQERRRMLREGKKFTRKKKK